MRSGSSRLVFSLMVLVGSIGCASAQANPFAKGNAKQGQALHEAKCAACHNSMMPGNKGEELYDEFNRKMKNAAQLKGMVEFCANRTKSEWFDEEITSVSRYLNDSFYKFK
ncbi:MAG: hypothetical protein RLY30_1881 [Pseudomonadota bacterium]